ncbi:NADH:flavin oxidoreductase/NADH oxidase [Haloechinothrix salitolerans]|uniref:NADH:flavin oxidoreductase/NADH oxidase n=1 Tax=Haloechinothrix salitolerans TaxID=926830 RepID=A0ABW2C5Z7_9PSEU
MSPAAPTSTSGSLLFRPIQLNTLELDNRIVISPMGMFSASADGIPGDWHKMHLGTLALSGAGLVIMEATAVSPEGRASDRCTGLWTDEHAAAMHDVLSFCRRLAPAKFGIQLSHMGRKAGRPVPWKAHRQPAEGLWDPVAPSAIAYPGNNVPHPLSKSEMSQLLRAFADAARRADDIGFDLLELHSAHGYLLHSYLSPHSNARTDRYGGTRSARMRFPLEVFEAVRAAWPSGKPLGVRVSATDWTPQGWQLEDTVAFASELASRGCDYLCLSSGGSSPEQRIELSPGYQVGFAETVKTEAGITTMAVGLITTASLAEQILKRGQADLVAIGRAALANPRWPLHAAVELGEAVGVAPQYARAFTQLPPRGAGS